MERYQLVAAAYAAIAQETHEEALRQAAAHVRHRRALPWWRRLFTSRYPTPTGDITLFDIKAAEAEAIKEVQEEALKVAKGKIKESLRKIAAAEAVLANLRREHEVILRSAAE
jgi:hypothetical protein